MQARDLREFEDIDQSTENVSFASLARGDLEGITDLEVVGKSGSIQIDVNLPGTDVTLASQEYVGDIVYEDGEPEIYGFGGLPGFLSEQGSDLLRRLDEASIDDNLDASSAIEATPPELRGLEVDSGLEDSETVDEYLRNVVEEGITGDVIPKDDSNDSALIISPTMVWAEVRPFFRSSAISINDLQYNLEFGIDFEGPLSDDAPIDRIREEFDFERIEREVEEMMSSYEVEEMPEDFDHPNGDSGKAVEMNLNYDSLAAEYCEASSSGPWPLRDTTTRDDIAEFYITGSNIYSKDKTDIELFPFLIDQLRDDIESQGGSIETVVSGAVRINNYDELDEETQEKLDLIEESTYRTYVDEEEGTVTYVDGSSIQFERMPEIEIEIDSPEYLEVEAEAEVDSRTYSNTEEIRRIAQALDPMNFNKSSYDEVEFETGFDASAVETNPAS